MAQNIYQANKQAKQNNEPPIVTDIAGSCLFSLIIDYIDIKYAYKPCLIVEYDHKVEFFILNKNIKGRW